MTARYPGECPIISYLLLKILIFPNFIIVNNDAMIFMYACPPDFMIILTNRFLEGKILGKKNNFV